MKYLSTILLLCVMSSRILAAPETAVRIIPLSPPLDQADAEISGLTWCGDKLILMPQYPRRLSDTKQSYFYYIDKQRIDDFLDGKSSAPLAAKKILINERDLRKTVAIFDGFEAIACQDDTVWLSIEAINYLGTYQSFVVPGTIRFSANASITIDQTRLTKLETQSNMRNMGDEAIFIDGQSVVAIHEVNDPRVNAKPTARRVELDTNRKTDALRSIPFPALPYRITDATALDAQNRFWTINYKYSGDTFNRDATDRLADKYGQGQSHKKYDNVERLVEFQLNENRVELVNSAPIQLEMIDVEGRNWEGLVRLDNRGFLLATDKHPRTLLGYVPYSDQ